MPAAGVRAGSAGNEPEPMQVGDGEAASRVHGPATSRVGVSSSSLPLQSKSNDASAVGVSKSFV